MDKEERHWLRIGENDSWHIVDHEMTDDAGFTVIGTLCGLKPRHHDFRQERPGNEATCENCLRIWTKD